MSRRLFTSESVTEGHPDKIADAISDSILDALLAEDPKSRVAVETLIMTGQVHIAGEVTTEAYADIPAIVRDRILEIGYDSSKKGFDGASCGVSVSIGAQSPDIAQGVDDAYEHRVEGETDELEKQGAGNVTLTKANTFTGDTRISGGSLILSTVATNLLNSTLDYNDYGGVLSFGTLTAASIGGLKGGQNLTLANTSAAIKLVVPSPFPY